MRIQYGLLLLALLAGCTSVPKPSPYPYSSQQKMQAAHHWNELASEVAEEVAARLKGGSGASVEWVYVPSDDTSPFGEAFHDLLITELMKRGIPASSNPNSPLMIEWKVQRVAHNANRSNPSFPFGWLTGGITALVASPFVDVGPVFGPGPLPHSEIIITTELKDKNKPEEPLLRNSDIYYSWFAHF
jgi:hypothetical protein